MTLTCQKVNSAKPWSATRVHDHINELNFQTESVKLDVTPQHER